MADRVTVGPAPPDAAGMVARMVAAYLDELGLDAPMTRAMLPLYWSEAGRWPFLIRAGGEAAGFALVREAGPGLRELAEFSVLPLRRGRGIGGSAAQQIFLRFPGDWRLKAVPDAEHFWDRTITTAGFAAQHADDGWRHFTVPKI